MGVRSAFRRLDYRPYPCQKSIVADDGCGPSPLAWEGILRVGVSPATSTPWDVLHWKCHRHAPKSPIPIPRTHIPGIQENYTLNGDDCIYAINGLLDQCKFAGFRKDTLLIRNRRRGRYGKDWRWSPLPVSILQSFTTDKLSSSLPLSGTFSRLNLTGNRLVHPKQDDVA